MIASSVDVDEDLAFATSQRLSLGPSIVTDLIELASCVLPRKLYPGLYDNSMNDTSMSKQQRPGGGTSPDDENKECNMVDSATSGEEGVPGFPDFPDCWQGETSIERIKNNDGSGGRGGGDHKWKTTGNQSRHRVQRKSLLRRQAVNTYGIPKIATAAKRKGKEIKKHLREKRRIRRLEVVAKLHERRGRKSDMGSICRGLESIGCK